MLSNDKSVVRYAISAAVTAYDIDFPFWDFSEIVVTATNSATGASVVLKKDVDYTITVSEAITDPVYQDGTVNMISDTYKSYNALVISRELSLTQDADYKNGEPINADTLEMSLDRTTAQIQQVAEEAGHSLKLPATENAGEYTMPEASQRERKVLGFDSDGKTIVMFSNPDDAIEQANNTNQQSSQILQETRQLKEGADDAKAAAENAQKAAETAQAAAEQAKANTQEIADEAETTIGNSNTTGLRGEAVTAIQTALENALASIGESNSEGARGDAIEAITAALNAALASIGQTDSTGARGEALTAIATALTNALAAIGESNDAGARGSAIAAISQALANALNAIGESNAAGARGDAISAIAEALDEALAAIGTSDTTGARGAAITAIQNALNTALASWESQVEADNAALDQKIAGANATIDEKVQDASDSASAALASQNAAKASEGNAKASETAAKASETNAKTSETNAKNSETASATSEENAKTSETNAASSASEALSSKNAAATSEKNAKTSETNAKASETAAKNAEIAAETAQTKAEEAQAAAEAAAEQAQAAADIDIASPTKTGIAKLYDSARGQNTDGAVNQKAINDELVANDTKIASLEERMQNAEDEIDNINASVMLPIPQIQLEKNASNDSATLIVTNNWTGYDNVVVRIKNGADPTESDPVVPSAGYTITANGNWFVRAFPGTGATNKPSPSACALVSGLRVQRPTMSYNDDTYTVTLNCATAGATIRYTTDGTNPTATTGNVYSGPFTVSVTCTIIFQAYKDGLIASETASGEATVAKINAVRRKRASNNSSEWERLTPSSDPLNVVTETISVEPVAEITGTRSGQSVFDSYKPWQKKMRNFEDNGNKGAWMDESSFTLTGKDVMVYYPEDCYIKLVISSDGYTYRYISDAPMEGFVKAPWAGMYGARYKTSNNNQSRSGATITVSQSIVQMRENAQAKGTGWGLHDFIERCANEWLFIVEYASYNCQAKIGAGVSSASAKITTGGTDVMTFHTGRPAGTETSVSVQYRYSEDLWGNTHDWCDGINIINGQTWVSTNWQNYQSDVTAGYTAIGTALSGNNSGYISELVEDEENAWCCGVPKAFSGSDTTYITDYAYYYSGTYVLRVGGRWNYGSFCGLFYFRAIDTSSYTYSDIGSRLTYREASAA